jgi:hypothetical protein
MLKFLYILFFNFSLSSINLEKLNSNIENSNFLQDFYKKNHTKEIDELDNNEPLLNLLFINIFEFILFFLLTLILGNMKIIFIFVFTYIMLILYNTFFFLGKYLIHTSIIFIIFTILFWFSTGNVFFIMFLMGILRLFTIFLVFNKIFNIWKESSTN